MLIKQAENKITLFKSEDFLKNRYISYLLKDDMAFLRANLYARKGETLHRISLNDFLHVVNEYKISEIENKEIVPFLEEMPSLSVQEEYNRNKNNYLFDYSLSIQNVTIGLFTNNNDKEFMIGIISLSINRFRSSMPFEFNIHYLLKDKESGLIYSSIFPAFNEDVFKFLDNEYIESIYKYDRPILQKMIPSTTMTNAYAFIEKLIKTDSSILNGFEEHICKNEFTFLKNKKDYSFITNLVNQIILPYKLNLSFPYNDLSVLDIRVSMNQKLYESLLKETNPVKQVKHFLPKANKKTVESLRNLFNNPFDDSDSLFNHSRYIDFVFMNLFTTTERMNQFIDSILFTSDETNQSVEYILTLNDSYHKKIYNFVENNLIKFFSSRKSMEEFIIKQMNLYTEEVFEESSFLDNEEEDTDEEDDDYYFRYKKTNFEQLVSDLEELEFIYNRFQHNENHFKGNPSKRNNERYFLMQSLYNRKFENLKELHDEISILNSNTSGDENKEYESSSLIETDLSLNEYSLVEVSNSLLLKEVGIRMSHCVFSYEDKIIKKESFIFIIKNTLTNKFEICLEYDVKSNAIIQAKGRKNSIVRNKEVLSLVKLFKDKNNLMINTDDLPLKMNK